MFNTYLTDLQHVLTSIEATEGNSKSKCAEMIEKVIGLLLGCKENKRKVIWIGNGGSAAIASHSALDYWRTAGIRSINFNDGTLLTCISNDFGYEFVFQKSIEMFAEPGDLLVAISSSGKSLNVINGVLAARKLDCKVITLSGFSPDNCLRAMGDINFYAPAYQYGQVELVHSVICHSFLDLLMVGGNEVVR
jgi:D-sedoheptulose 7-phosphate isomerase